MTTLLTGNKGSECGYCRGDFLCSSPIHVPHNGWKEQEEDKVKDHGDTSASPVVEDSSPLEDLNCSVPRPVTSAETPIIRRPSPSRPCPRSAGFIITSDPSSPVSSSTTVCPTATDQDPKMVSTSIGLSLLLDSLLCALAPVFSLTAQIPELKNCSQHNMASTLENISYVMPGL